MNASSIKQLQQDLAAAVRLAERFGFNEGICNHFSVQLPDGRFLLNPHGVHWSRIRTSDILIIDPDDGNEDIEVTALHIHGAVHRMHPAAHCVMHTHMPYATALTCLKQGRLEYTHQNSLRFYNDVAYDDDYGGLAESAEEGSRIAEKLGRNMTMFMSNHGVMVIGSSIAEAFDRLYYLERACEVQVLAMSTGRPLDIVSETVALQTKRDFDAGGTYADLHFAGLKPLLDRNYLR
jgi:ribulose-5-phosphate 4-epimerase/fuculose-1-phosphate aldolase